METYNISNAAERCHLISDSLAGLFDDGIELFPASENRLLRDQEFIAHKLSTDLRETILELSKLGKAIETSLITGEPFKNPNPTFFPYHEGTSLPDFLYSSFVELFHADGCLIFSYNAKAKCFQDADGSFFPMPGELTRSLSDHVIFLRQVTLMFSKLRDVECISHEEEEIAHFVERIQASPDIHLSRWVVTLARRFLSDILTPDGHLHASIAQWLDQPFGAHGPGAVYNGEQGTEKWFFSPFSGQLERIYESVDLTDTFLSSESNVEPYSRVCIVPKDFRGHRLICIEQKEMMFAQQGLWRVLEHIIADSQLARCVDFRDQSKNYEASRRFDNMCTIDLKDASDRISLDLARLLFPGEVLKILTRFRARGIELPDGGVIQNYNTLFTMGNALCFPVQTLIFSALAYACERHYGGKSHKEALSFRVFGDDIIVDNRVGIQMCRVLSDAGLLVNREKFCYNTPVRESCGSWFYAGVDAVITKLKVSICSDHFDWIALVDSARLLYNRGFEHASLRILSHCEALHTVPYGFFDLPGTKKTNKTCYRWNSQFQRLEFRMPALEQRQIHLPGKYAYYAYFCGGGRRVVASDQDKEIVWLWIGVS